MLYSAAISELFKERFDVASTPTLYPKRVIKMTNIALMPSR